MSGFQSQHNTTRSAFNAERGWGVDLSVGRDFGKVVAKLANTSQSSEIGASLVTNKI